MSIRHTCDICGTNVLFDPEHVEADLDGVIELPLDQGVYVRLSFGHLRKAETEEEAADVDWNCPNIDVCYSCLRKLLPPQLETLK